MAEAITVTCPECEHSIRAAATVEGKKVRCKECGHVFVAGEAPVPKPAPAAKKAPPKEAVKKEAPKKEEAPKAPIQTVRPGTEEDEEGPPNYDVTDISLAPRCPECANEMESADAVVCLHCGFHTRKRTRASTRKIAETTGGEIFVWLLPGILNALGVILLIVWDILWCVKANDWLDPNAWTYFFAHFAIKMWMCIMSFFFMYYMGKYAIHRLCFDNKPPEVEEK